MSEQTQAAVQAGAVTEDADSLLEEILKQTKYKSAEEKSRNTQYIGEVLKYAMQGAKVVSGDMERTIKGWQAEIDRKISQQLNEILHHEKFQTLESTWRGLKYLIDQSETGATLKIKVMNVSKKTLLKDLEKAAEFDQSTLFKKVYEEEYGTLGGHPFGMMVGDYYFSNSPEDVEMLRKVSGVAAAAHAPFVAGVAPQMFGFDSFEELNKPRDLAKIFEGVDYVGWRSFRESADSRYVALTMPRVLARLPYGRDTKPIEEFNYEENVDGTDHSKYLWMNASWAYAARCTDAFAKDGWFMRTRGVEGGGKVEALPVHTFQVGGGKEMKCPTETLIPDRRENELSNLGFLPLLHCKNTDFAAFLGAQSCQKPQTYFDATANANAELSTKINYLMCVSRFSHYLKVMARNKVGSIMEANECERWLNEWIKNYVVSNPENVGESIKAKCPLRAAEIRVEANPAKPGWYKAVAYLRPHFQLEGLDASMRLVAEIPPKKG
jgi:type VI secretion system protein ImpC